MTGYWASTHIPPLVQRAQEAARLVGFTKSSLPQVGRMLYLLTSLYPQGRIGELGTGCGVGAAWMVSALGPGAAFYSIDSNPELTAAVQPIFSNLPNVHLVTGNWMELLQYGPFDLLFVDVSEPKQTMPDELLAALRIGGTLVVDDMTPEELRPPERRQAPDPVRERLLNGRDLAGFEIFLPPDAAMILAVRRA